MTGTTATFVGAAASGAALVTIENNSGSTATSYGLLVKGGGNSSSGKTFEVRDDSGNTDLIVKGSGNVGIGNTDPVKNLDVRGSLAISNSSTSYWYLDRNDSSGTFDINTDDDVTRLKIDFDSNITIGTSGGGINEGAILLQNDHYVNKRFSFDPLVSNAPTAYMILCENAANQDVNGVITMDRTSGLRHACSIQVLISSGSGTSPVAGLKAMGVAGASTPFYELVTCDYDDGTGSSSHIAVKMSNPDGYYETSGAYFTGRIVNSNSGVIVPVLPAAVSNVVVFEANCKHNFQGDLTVNQGNVGIGTDSPGDVKLFVQNTNTPTTTNPVFETRLETTYNMGISNRWVSQYVSKLKIGRSGTAAEEISSMELIYDIAGAEYGSIKRNYSQSSLKFERSTTTDMIINGSGNVGIGTVLPTNGKFVINQNSSTASFGGNICQLFENFNTTDGQMMSIGFRNNNSVGTTAYIDAVAYDQSIGATDIRFSTYSGSAWSSNMVTFQHTGNVGIGTTSPDFALDIEVIDGGVQLQLGRTNTNAGSTWMGSDSNGFHLGVGAYGAGNSASDPNGFTVLTSGNVGIGTASPANKLQVTTGIGIGTTIGKNHLAGSLASGTSITLNANPAGGNNSAGLIVVSCVPNSTSAGGAIGIWTGLHTQGSNRYTLLQQENENNITIVESGGQYTITNNSGARAYYQLKVLNLTDFASTIGGF